MTKKIETIEDVIDYKIENCVFYLMKNSMEGFIGNMKNEKIRKISKDIIDIASKEAKKRIDEWVDEMDNGKDILENKIDNNKNDKK